MHEQTICAALFAGGASRRMGTDKALLPWRGSTLVRYLAGELGFFSEKLLSAQKASLLPGADWRLVPDLRSGCGPLGALESVLSAMRSDAALCVACDLPFFTRELGQAMLRAFREGADCLVCRDETGRVHPVCAIYHRRALAGRERAAAGGRFSHDAPARESEDRLFSGHSRADAEREYAGNLERNTEKRACLMQVRPLRCSAGAGFLRAFALTRRVFRVRITIWNRISDPS